MGDSSREAVTVMEAILAIDPPGKDLGTALNWSLLSFRSGMYSEVQDFVPGC